MNVRKKGLLLIILLIGILITGCSSMTESKLVGQWQSKGPNGDRINITKVGTNDEGFHQTYKTTKSNGDTYLNDWKIESGNMLTLKYASYMDLEPGWSGRGHNGHAHYQIIELTSDRLVTQFNGKIEEFQRIK